jgi:hypothetical protein
MAVEAVVGLVGADRGERRVGAGEQAANRLKVCGEGEWKVRMPG